MDWNAGGGRNTRLDEADEQNARMHRHARGHGNKARSGRKLSPLAAVAAGTSAVGIRERGANEKARRIEGVRRA
jgi:hypothetical protein